MFKLFVSSENWARLPGHVVQPLSVLFSTYISIGLQSNTIIQKQNHITFTTPGSLQQPLTPVWYNPYRRETNMNSIEAA